MILTILNLSVHLATVAAQLDFKSRCVAFGQNANLADYLGAVVTRAEYLAQNATIDQFAEGTNITCTLPNPVVPVNLCRLGFYVPTSGASEVYMEAWLPEQWNSRLIAVGNGGLAGCIMYPDLAYVASRGFASVASNNGHNGTSAGAFYHQSEVLEDFVWRALYTTTGVGKCISKQFYGQTHKKSYYMGCSQGGRQGFKAAQVNPDLFDGIIAGAPGLRLPGLFQQGTRWLRTIGSDASNLTISAEKWSAIQNETLRQCDHLDEITDGIIEDTRSCKPDLSVLQCGTAKGPNVCLSSSEIALVTKLFAPWTIGNNTIYHGMAHNGGELTRATTLSSAEFLAYALEWPRFVSRENSAWTLDQWKPLDAVLALEQNFFGFNTWDGDLSEFRDRGGKILHYHGQLDQAIDTTVSDAYYDLVAETLSASSTELDEFYRYFRISGLQHCTGGPGASSIGQSNSPPPESEDPEDNVLSRIVKWVEQGEAPDSVRGTKFVDGDATKGVDYKRNHCRYPLRNVYDGEGDGTDEEGWQCVSTRRTI